MTKSRPFRVHAVAALVSLVVVVVGTTQATRAAFVDTEANGENVFASGSVTVTDDDGGSALFSVSNVGPGSTLTRCVNVVYQGSADAILALYGSLAGGNGLEEYLDLTVERGAGAGGGTNFDCTGFADEQTIWDPASGGSLGDFLSEHGDATAALEPHAVAGGQNFTTSYRFTLTVQDNDAAESLSAIGLTLTWEAQNQ